MQLFTNNGTSTFANAISNVALSLQVQAGDGAKFPNPTGGDYFLLTLYKMTAGVETALEIVKCTARSSDVLTIVRAQEGTTANAYATNDLIALRLTAGSMSTDSIAEGASNKYFTSSRVLNTVLTGLNTATNQVVSATDTVLAAIGYLQKQVTDILTTLTSHSGNNSNPHSTTKAQVGLGNVDNTSDANKPVSTAAQTALNSKQDASGKDASSGYAGLTLFKINFQNVANTFTSFFTNSNTASRTYTFQDRNGTIADLGANTFVADQVHSDYKITQAMLKDCGYTSVDKGNSSTTTQTLDYTVGSYQKVTATGAFTLATSNWPSSGNCGELLLELVNGGSYTITWPTINWIKSDGTTTTTFSSNGITLRASGSDFILLWSVDAGVTIYGKVVR